MNNPLILIWYDIPYEWQNLHEPEKTLHKNKSYSICEKNNTASLTRSHPYSNLWKVLQPRAAEVGSSYWGVHYQTLFFILSQYPNSFPIRRVSNGIRAIICFVYYNKKKPAIYSSCLNKDDTFAYRAGPYNCLWKEFSVYLADISRKTLPFCQFNHWISYFRKERDRILKYRNVRTAQSCTEVHFTYIV